MTEIIDTSFIPSNPADKQRIRLAIQEAAGLKQMQKDKGDQIKDIVDTFCEEFNMSKRLFRKMITIQFKGNYSEEAALSAAQEIAWESIMETNNP